MQIKNETNLPLIIHGESGSGKSSLIAKSAFEVLNLKLINYLIKYLFNLS